MYESSTLIRVLLYILINVPVMQILELEETLSNLEFHRALQVQVDVMIELQVYSRTKQ